MKQLKDIAVAMDCHVKTARRWFKKLGVPPDVCGHGANRWHENSFKKLIRLWETYYSHRGTTPAIVRSKFAGQWVDPNQLTFDDLQKIKIQAGDRQVKAGCKGSHAEKTRRAGLRRRASAGN